MADIKESPESYQPHTSPSQQNAAIPERIENWRRDLLKDMTLLPKIKAQKAGRIVVYGDQAVPVLSGPRNEHVVFAAAEFGPKNGRVVVLSHHRYLAHFCIKTDREELSILQENINHWVTKGEFANQQQVEHLKCKENLSGLKEGTKILIWDATYEASSEELEQDVMAFLSRGGALVYAICPHKWKERNKKTGMKNVPLGNILSTIGIGFCPHKVPYGSSKGFKIATDMSASEHALSHAQFLVNACCTETNAITLQKYALKFVHYFRDAPAELLEYLKDKLCMLFAKGHEVIAGNTPTEDNKLTDIKTIAMNTICGVLSEFEMGYNKMPGVEHFPGEVPIDTPLHKCVDLTIKSQGHEAHPTGYWVPAGTQCEIRVVGQMSSCDEMDDYAEGSSDEESEPDDSDDLDDWFIRIGCHSDTLYHKETLKRLPNLLIKARLKSEQLVFTPYGGLLYFVSPRTMSQISVQISGVVEAPYFDLKEPATEENWMTIRNAPGPWADICGHWFHISVPSSSIRSLVNPSQVMKVWDNVVLQNHDLRGSRPMRKEWLVADVQPVIGKMHSGYPIVANMKVTEPDGVLSFERLTNFGFWGIFHELGHNMQRNMWTFEGTREVTCNIFSLYAAEHMAKQNVWIHDWLKRHMVKIKEYLEDGAEFSDWQMQSGVALGFYAQLAHHFGWQIYKRVFWRYEITPVKRRPTTSQARIDEWILRFSDATGYNIVPLAEFWGIPVSPEAQQKIKPLKAFLPDDEMTQMEESRVKTLLQKYPGMARAVDKDRLKLDKHWCPLV